MYQSYKMVCCNLLKCLMRISFWVKIDLEKLVQEAENSTKEYAKAVPSAPEKAVIDQFADLMNPDVLEQNQNKR